MEMIKTKTANAIRVLSADAIEKAKSGHPGLPLGLRLYCLRAVGRAYETQSG